MSEVITRSIRVGRDTWRDFRQLQIDLERQTPGRLTQAQAFRICVTSMAAAVAKEAAHVANPGKPVEVKAIVWPPQEPSG